MQRQACFSITVLFCLAVAICELPQTSGFPFFRDRIPNGYHVMNPYRANITWQGVGHLVRRGGGARNPFGLDFAKMGHKWSKALCNKDSDGDGKSNGEELGDPNCRWQVGQTPERTENITHPGFCEPVRDPKCKQKKKKNNKKGRKNRNRGKKNMNRNRNKKNRSRNKKNRKSTE